MTRLEEVLREWPIERAREIMEARKIAATSGPGNICIPSSDSRRYFPFNHSSYPHIKAVGSLIDPPWDQVCATPPQDLIPVDPFAVSSHRPGKLQIWDAAIGIPASVVRQPHTVKTNMLPTVRSINTQWQQQTMTALTRVGPLGPNGEFLRPVGSNIVDVTCLPFGWRFLEAAHALAHRAADLKPREHKKTIRYAGSTHFHMQRYIALLSFCLQYGLPIDVLCLDEGIKGCPDIRQYGIELKSSSYFRSPVLRVPVSTGECCRPDETIALVSAGVYIEPHPHGFTTETGRWKEVNIWSCSPTVVVIAGWELVDVVTHQTICSTDPTDRGEPICYGMVPADLMPAATFGAFIRMAVEARGMPTVDNKRYWYVEDWLESQDCRQAIAESPPLPCIDCLRLNMRSEGTPARPMSRYPEDQSASMLKGLLKEEKKTGKKLLRTNEREWAEWLTNLDDIAAIVEKAVIAYETRLYGGYVTAMRYRKSRVAMHNWRVQLQKDIQVLERRIAHEIEKAHLSSVPALRYKLAQLKNRLERKGATNG